PRCAPQYNFTYFIFCPYCLGPLPFLLPPTTCIRAQSVLSAHVRINICCNCLGVRVGSEWGLHATRWSALPLHSKRSCEKAAPYSKHRIRSCHVPHKHKPKTMINTTSTHGNTRNERRQALPPFFSTTPFSCPAAIRVHIKARLSLKGGHERPPLPMLLLLPLLLIRSFCYGCISPC
ncbi:unnamed protein product, partial [Ectocarpus sp. 13 AM-2016]